MSADMGSYRELGHAVAVLLHRLNLLEMGFRDGLGMGHAVGIGLGEIRIFIRFYLSRCAKTLVKKYRSLCGL